MRTYGTGGRVVCASTGIELPDPDGPRARATEETATVQLTGGPVGPVQAGGPVQPPGWSGGPGGGLVDGPVRCDVCGVSVAAEYVARTGQRRHRPCQQTAEATPDRTSTGRSGVREVA